MDIFEWIYLGSAVTYCFIILYFFVGIYRIKLIKYSSKPFVSVLVPARNEEQEIVKCLESLYRQTYPSHLFEVIVIEDHSIDETPEKIADFIEGKSNFKMLIHKADGKSPTFKKQALKFGMEKAQGEIIMTVDADTIVQPHWIEKMVSFYGDNTGLVAGIISFLPESERNLFHKLQTLEFVGIVFSGIGCVGNKNPIICNGSNLSFKREAFDEVGGYDAHLHLASGDDDLLIQNIHKNTPWRVTYSLDPRTINYTKAVNSLSAFLNQRSRWASKSLHYPSKGNFFIFILIYVFYILTFILLPLSIFDVFPLKIYLAGIFLKFIPEVLVISKGLEIINRQDLLKLFPIAQIFQVPYIILVVLRGLLKKFDWKVSSNDIS
jgi:cellulose synthase/poly-beta-1,6-N-acetylglucosamine synthase-like glycosyltransferase